MVVSDIQGNAGETFLPPASHADRLRDSQVICRLLAVGTRWNMMLILPCCLVLAIMAPQLLRVWVGPEGLPAVAARYSQRRHTLLDRTYAALHSAVLSWRNPIRVST